MAFVVALGMSKTPRVGDNTHPLDEDRTREVLREQLGFLKSSANAYNQGNTSEAKRLATTARTLVHTGQSASVLKLLGREKKLEFWDTATRLAVPPDLVGVDTFTIGYPDGREEQANSVPATMRQIAHELIVTFSRDRVGDTFWVLISRSVGVGPPVPDRCLRHARNDPPELGRRVHDFLRYAST